MFGVVGHLDAWGIYCCEFQKHGNKSYEVPLYCSICEGDEGVL